MESQIKQLVLELTSLREKYANDTATGKEQISGLQETIQKMEKVNAERIEALDALNKDLEAKSNREIHKLNQQIALQKAAFNQERAQILQEHEKKESDLLIQLDSLKKTIAPKELEISSLKSAIGEISIQLGEATALSKALKKARDETLAELDSAKAANAELIKKMDAFSDDSPLRNKQPQTKP